jgi:hypothetical protein
MSSTEDLFREAYTYLGLIFYFVFYVALFLSVLKYVRKKESRDIQHRTIMLLMAAIIIIYEMGLYDHLVELESTFEDPIFTDIFVGEGAEPDTENESNVEFTPP